jgi:hypothetical protein
MTKKIKSIVYGLGGFDETKPNNNLTETIYYSVEELATLAEAEAKAQAKAIAEGKLAALGLTTDDLRALGL